MFGATGFGLASKGRTTPSDWPVALAAPAHAITPTEITHSEVTSPSGSFYSVYDSDAASNPKFTFSGTSDGGAVQTGRSGADDLDAEVETVHSAGATQVFTAVTSKETARWRRDQGH